MTVLDKKKKKEKTKLSFINTTNFSETLIF